MLCSSRASASRPRPTACTTNSGSGRSKATTTGSRRPDGDARSACAPTGFSCTGLRRNWARSSARTSCSTPSANTSSTDRAQPRLRSRCRASVRTRGSSDPSTTSLRAARAALLRSPGGHGHHDDVSGRAVPLPLDRTHRPASSVQRLPRRRDRSSSDAARGESTSLYREIMKCQLIVGIDHYAHWPLTGCAADTEAVVGLLKRKSYGSPNWTADLVVSCVGETLARSPGSMGHDVFMSDTPGLPSLKILLDQVAAERETMNAHAESLDGKAGVILGFAGVLVGLGATAQAAISTNAVFQSGLAVAVVAAGLAAWAVLPRPYPVMQVLPARQKFLTASESETQLQLLDLQIEMVVEAAEQVKRKGSRVRWSVTCLAIAAALVVIGTLSAGGQTNGGKPTEPGPSGSRAYALATGAATVQSRP